MNNVNNKFARLRNTSGYSYEINTSITTLGRAEDSQIFLNSEKASRQHAEIRFKDGKYFIADLNSRNGTKLNGQTIIDEQPLNNGNIIRLGGLEFVFEEPSVGETLPGDSTVDPLSNPITPVKPVALLVLEPATMQVWVRGQKIEQTFTKSEWKLLNLLYENRNQICDREQIVEKLYQTSDEDQTPSNAAIDTQISRLRLKLPITDPQNPPYLKTIRGVGFKLEL